MRVVFILLVFFLSTIFLTTNTYALEEIGQSQIHPAHPIYFLKTVREEFEKHFAQTSYVKFMRSLEFGTRRLREVKSLVTVEREDLIEPNLERYWSHISSLPQKDLEDKELAKRIEESLVIHIKTLDKIYHQVSNIRAKMSIRSALNRLMQRADLPAYARVPICEFFQKEATSSSELNEAEKAILLDRAQKCHQL